MFSGVYSRVSAAKKLKIVLVTPVNTWFRVGKCPDSNIWGYTCPAKYNLGVLSR